MTISTEVTQSGPHEANGLTRDWPFSFRVYASSEVELRYWTATQDPETDAPEIIDPALYSVTGLGTDTGFVTYPLTGDPVASGFFSIGRVPSYLQPYNVKNQGTYNPAQIETALDRAAMRDLDLKQRVDELEERVEAVEETVSANTPDIEDDNVLVLADATVLNMGVNLSVVNEGGGKATINATGQQPTIQKDDASVVTGAATVNFEGNVTVVDEGGGKATVTIPKLTVQEEGTSVATNFTTLNFVGSGVTATDGGSGVATITIPGGGGGGIAGIVIEDQGVQEGVDITTLNFSTGFSVTVAGAEATITSGDPPAPAASWDGATQFNADLFGYRYDLADTAFEFYDALQPMLLAWELDSGGSPYTLAKRDHNQAATILGPNLVTLNLPGSAQPGSGTGQVDGSYLHPTWGKRAFLRIVFLVIIRHSAGVRLAATNNGRLLYRGRQYTQLDFTGAGNVDRMISLINASTQWYVWTDASLTGSVAL